MTQKLRRQRRIAIRDALAKIMSRVEPTHFAAEGPARAGVRVALCLAGWRWQSADDEAALLTFAALQMIGARRPSWAQGQPSWTEDGHAPIPRERCARCARPLPEDRRKYCSDVCRNSANLDYEARRDKEERAIAKRAYRAAWSERQPERPCPVCGTAFRPKWKTQLACSRACANADRRLPRSVPALCEGL